MKFLFIFPDVDEDLFTRDESYIRCKLPGSGFNFAISLMKSHNRQTVTQYSLLTEVRRPILESFNSQFYDQKL